MSKSQFFVFIAALCILIIWIWHNFTMNFGILGVIFIIVLVAFPYYYHKKCCNDVLETKKLSYRYDCKIGLFDYIFTLIGASLLLLLGFACIFTLNNYFYAESKVYRNIDHHAMRIDGIVIEEPNQFLLAGNSRRAFFDDRQMNGQAKIIGVTDTTVIIELNDFTRPIYLNTIDHNKKRCVKQTIINESSLVTLEKDDHLQLKANDHNVFDFFIKEVNKDSVCYFLLMPDGDTIKSDENRFLTKGLPMPLLTSSPAVQSYDFAGLNLVRNVIYPLVKQDEKITKYTDTHYCLEVQGPSCRASQSLKQVRTSNNPWQDLSTTKRNILEIPLDSVFVIGFGDNCTRQAYFSRSHPQANGQLTLLYRQPMYSYFEQTPDKVFNNVCVTTSLNSFLSSIETMPENILFFDAFSHPDNINNIKPFTLSYVSGPTSDSLQFLYDPLGSSGECIRAGVFLKDMTTIENKNVRWLAQVENFRDTAPYQPDDIKWYIICFTLALVVLLCIGACSVKDKKSAERNTFTTLEFSAYAITIYLVSFRWFLLWRTSVFVPVENISYYEFEGLFRNPENGDRLRQCMIIFCVIIFFAKLAIRFLSFEWDKSSIMHWGGKHKNLKYLWIVVYVILIVICWMLRNSSMARFVIIVPVLLYLVTSAFVARHFGKTYNIADREYKKLKIKDPPAMLFILSLLNAIIISAFLIWIDKGFGILFATFSMFWISWLLYEHVTHYLSSNLNIFRHSLSVIAIFLAVLLLVGFYKYIFGKVYYYPGASAVCLAFAGGCLAALVFYILDWGNKITRIFWTFIVVVFFSIGSYGFHYIVSNYAKHTAQRIVVHFEKPEEAMKSIDNEQNEKRFLQTALNHMIIGVYNERGDDVSLIFEKGNGYFKMQPHSKVGAMWNAQLTDISIARFVIAEHSPLLPILIVIFFLLMLGWAARQPIFFRWTRVLLLQIPLLLMVQSLLIWMATTRRFIFLGQDFPMVSINSRLTIVYYFSLITLWIVVAIYSKVNFTKAYLPQFNKEIKSCSRVDERIKFRYKIPIKESNKIFVIMVICLGLGWGTPQWNSDTNEIENMKEPAFRLSNLMKELSGTIEIVNDNLLQYQIENYPDGWPKKEKLTDVSEFMQKFNNTMQIDSLFRGSAFGLRLWKNFINKDSRSNNTHNVIYAQIKTEIDKNLKTHRFLRLRTVNTFYDQSLPQPKDKVWRGNVVASADSIVSSTRNIRTSSLWATRLPADWMADGVERVIVSKKNARVLGSEANFTMQKGIKNAIVLEPNIVIDDPEVRKQLRTIKHFKNYFARNVMINGRREMFYTLGSSLYWIKAFSDELMKQRNDIPIEERNANFNNDVELSLLPDMNKYLVAELKKSGADHCSVIVANGDGEVWAIANYNKGFQLDPNDWKQVRNMADSLSLYGAWGSSEARYAFGNQNLMNLPFGPGSTQKPLVWTAVASKVDYPHWQDLRIQKYEMGDNGQPKWISEEGRSYVITHFNGMKFRDNNLFKPLKSDEQSGRIITLRGYMAHSSNVYNALMAYIGSFSEVELKSFGFFNIAPSHNEQSLFALSDDNVRQIKELYIERFPLLSLNYGKEFSLNKKLPITDQSNSLLNRSMEDMFFRNSPEEILKSNNRLSNPANGVLEIDSAMNSLAYIERSHFETRHAYNEQDFMENAIRSTAIGGSKVWYITPWKMAEAYGRMASLNKNLHLSVIKHQPISYETFSNLSESYLKARPEQMKGMGDVITIGTANSVGLHLSINAKNAPAKYKGYYIYAKTGTIGPGSNDHHRFGVIISNIDLANANLNQLKNARYVSLYFTFNTTGKWDTYANVIHKIVDSPEFKRYMNK